MLVHKLVNALGILVFILVAFLFSKKRKDINWKSILVLLVINFILAWFFTKFSLGIIIIKGIADFFTWITNVAYTGISFALPNWVHTKHMNFITSALLPILMIIPLFDILNYIGVLPFITKLIGTILSKVTGQPKFESFFAIEMMIIGGPESLAISSKKINQLSKQRNLTLAMMCISCVTASILGAYVKMVPGQFVLLAVPINIISVLIITSILNPVSNVDEEKLQLDNLDNASTDIIENDSYEEKQEIEREKSKKKEPFFSFLGDSILKAGRLVLIIAANVIAFVALANLFNKLLQFINPELTLEHIVGVILYPFAWLLGFNPHSAFTLAQYMGTKLITNEFVVMGQVAPIIHKFSLHFQAVLTVFLISFTNFSNIGMINGTIQSIIGKEKSNYISKNIKYMLLSGILVSLLSAGIVGLFNW